MTQTLEKLSTEIGKLLKAKQMILATAESCTAGGLGHWITFAPGSTDWFDRGAVTYSNQSKVDMLGVETKTIEQHGAVSEETALEMAEGMLARSNASISLSITGIAGPTGGTDNKPVGTVWFGIASNGKPTQTEKKVFDGDRQTVRLETIEHALILIQRRIK